MLCLGVSSVEILIVKSLHHTVLDHDDAVAGSLSKPWSYIVDSVSHSVWIQQGFQRLKSPYPEPLFRTLDDNLARPLYLRRSQTNLVAEILLNVWRSLRCGKRMSESNGKADVCAVQALFEGR
jgi:hypothetical protein